MRRALLVVLLLSAATVFAQQSGTITVEPEDPTSNHPVTLLVTQVDSCPPHPTVTRSGFDINVELHFGLCLSPPTLITWRLDVGVLPAGTYTVTVKDLATKSFTVLDANDSVVVAPSVGPIAGGSAVLVSASVDGTPVVTFDGVPAAIVIPDGNGQFRVTTPPHAPGAVLVTVTSGATTLSSYAFRYYDPAAPPLPELFAKILIPIFYDGTGLFGSTWATEVAIRNDNAYDVAVYRGPDAVPVFPAGTPKIVGFPASPRGVFMIVPREAEPEIHVNAIVREVSRPLDTWGTELPVVRESQFRKSIHLLNVPIDPHFRIFLRIYSLLPAVGHPVHVTAVMMTDGSLVGARDLQLTSYDPCPDPFLCASVQPAWVATLNFPNVPQPLPGERVAIRIDGIEPIWAFVTVTNNETQHVTVISPQ